MNKYYLTLLLIALLALTSNFVQAQDDNNDDGEDDQDVSVSHVAVGGFLSAEAVLAKNLALFNSSTNMFEELTAMDRSITGISAMTVHESSMFVAAMKENNAHVLQSTDNGPWIALGGEFFGGISELRTVGSKLYAVGSLSINTENGLLQHIVARDLDSSPSSEWSRVLANAPPTVPSKLFNLADGLCIQSGSSLYLAAEEDWVPVPGVSVSNAKQVGNRIFCYGGCTYEIEGSFVSSAIASSTDGSSWTTILSQPNSVSALADDGNTLYYTDGNQVFEGTSGASSGYLEGGSISDLVWYENSLYAIGSFDYWRPASNADISEDYRRPLSRVAVLSNNEWKPVFKGGFSGPVNHMVPTSDGFYFMGGFNRAFNLLANGIAGYDTKSKRWVNFGHGIDKDTGYIAAVHVDKTGSEASLIIGGHFGRYLGSNIYSIATVNITDKQIAQMGSGVQYYGSSTSGFTYGFVTVINKINGDVYIGGQFDRSGNTPLQNFARFNSEDGDWEDVLGGVDGNIITSSVKGSSIVLGGAFSRAGKLNVANIVKYKANDNEWEPLGSGLNGQVNNVIFDGNNVIACGSFNSAGGRRVDNVAIWESDHWKQLKCENESDEICNIVGTCQEVKLFSGDLFIRTSSYFYRYDGSKLINVASNEINFPNRPGNMMVSSPENSGNMWTIGMSASQHFEPHTHIGEFNPSTDNWLHNSQGGFSESPNNFSGAASVSMNFVVLVAASLVVLLFSSLC